MDISVLTEFFKELAFLDLPGPAYASYLVARVVIGLFKTVGFDLEQAKELLTGLGVKVKETLVPVLVEKAKEGIRELATWLRGQKQDVDVNEATAEILVNQAEAVGQALDMAELDNETKEDTAQQVKESLEGLGGAHSAIAEDYAQALLQPDMREVLMAKMAEGLQTWRRQSMEARRNSLIAFSEQIMEGDMPAEQRMVAEDHSKIIGGVQRIGPARPEQEKGE